MGIHIDFETKSEIDLGIHGVYVYAEHPSTDIYMAAIKEDHIETKLWINSKYHHLNNKSISDEELKELIQNTTLFYAYNANFERIIWNEIMRKRYDFPEIPLHKWRCTAAKAAMYALPRDLGRACEAVGIPEQKDIVGRRVMLKWCKPQKSTKTNSDIWLNDPIEFKRLCDYCIKDVEAEYAFNKKLNDLPEKELKLWQLDQKINDNGIYVDINSIKILIQKVTQKEMELLLEIQQITQGQINSVRQIEKTKIWLANNGVDLPDLQKKTVKDILKTKIPEKCKKLLKIRQALSKSSVAKLKAMDNMISKDNRVRGTLLYYGASTGRWSGKGVQPHNYPKNSFKESIIPNILNLSNELIDILYDDTIQVASKCLRGMLMSAPEKELYCADYSAIEARILAWIADEQEVLNAFISDKDPYIQAAAVIYNKPEKLITIDERFIGKTIVLACGYQGWVGAFRKIANEEVNKLSDEEIAAHISQWRNARPNIVSFWKGIENAAIQTVKTNKSHSYKKIKFGNRNNFLHCRLPSGRLLSYNSPELHKLTNSYGQKKISVTFMSMNSITNKWERQYTYGGKLTENIVQAIARDILAEALLRLDEKGYNIVMHVHDEIIVEEKINKNPDYYIAQTSLRDLEIIMGKIPKWAEGLPIKAEGWQGIRYRK